MSKTTASDSEKLQQLLGQELKLTEKIYELCKEQASLIDGNKIEQLNKSFNKAQELREKINGLHQETQSLMQSCVSIAQDEKFAAQIKETTGKIRELVEKSAKLNDDNMNAVKELQEDQKKKIEEQSAKRKGIGGYAQAITTAPELFDKKT